jgi:tetratricopeptide (TPR) repeat protein
MGYEEKRSFEHELMRNELMNQIQKHDVLELKEQKKVRRISIKWKHIVVAAVIIYIVGASLVIFQYRPLTDKIFANYYHKYKTDNIIASRLTFENSKLTNAAKVYNEGNYQAAIIQLQEIIKTDTTNINAYFLLGISFMEVQNYPDAITSLSYVIDQNSDIMEQTEWYLALCYLKTKRIYRAASILNKIANSDSYYKSMAVKILKKIE